MNLKNPIEPVKWHDNTVILIDQTRLPNELVEVVSQDPETIAQAIETMIVRGAPAIGVATGFGLALAALQTKDTEVTTAQKSWEFWCDRFGKTRPTAVNLFWAIERMRKCSEQTYLSLLSWQQALIAEAVNIKREDIEACKTIGQLGAALLPETASVLTHCNAGALATGGWGTALGVIRSAVVAGKTVHVWIDETRPFLQGARLTAWELDQECIAATLITDNMAAHFMGQGKIDAVIVGADRIAANGDTANKIGTYGLSILANTHGIPFYVAAPLSTIDLKTPSGKAIPIEERNPEEVKSFQGQITAPRGIPARHPAFDVTPAQYISAIITQAGVAKAPFKDSLAALFEAKPL